MKFTPRRLKWLLNLYPPYLGAGVKITYISEDWKELHVSMSLCWFNRNAVGTHFGGNLYSMIDPHLMLLLMQLLGKDYFIWDKSADIEFIKASRSRVTSIIKISNEDLASIKNHTAAGDKYLPEFLVEIKDEDNNVVARVTKTIYVRRKSMA